MFNPFKKSQPKTEQVVVAEKPKSSYPKEVHEIHNTFMNAGEKLLQEAKKIIANAEIKDEEKINRLKKIGFSNSKQVKDAERMLQKKKEAEQNAKIVEYYSVKYPQYKFVTESVVKQICEKWNLVMGQISQYRGFVPEKNLKEIESFSVKDGDCIEESNRYDMNQQMQMYLMMNAQNSQRNWLGIQGVGDSMGYDSYQRELRRMEERYYRDQIMQRPSYFIPSGEAEMQETTSKAYRREFKICAPIKDMDTSGYTKQGHKLIPDPVVLHPVKNGYLIVTAWGDEASDENVVNEKMN